MTLAQDGAIHYDTTLLNGALVASNFGFTTNGAIASTGSILKPAELAPPGGAGTGGTGGTTGTTTGGTTGGGTTGGGGGCGCGCGGGGSMMLQMK